MNTFKIYSEDEMLQYCNEFFDDNMTDSDYNTVMSETFYNTGDGRYVRVDDFKNIYEFREWKYEWLSVWR